MASYDLDGYDGVLAFGESIRGIYLQEDWSATSLDLARSGRHLTFPAPAAPKRGRSGLDRQLGRRGTQRPN